MLMPLLAGWTHNSETGTLDGWNSPPPILALFRRS